MKPVSRFAPLILALGAVALVATQSLTAQQAVRNATLDRMHDEAMAPAYSSVPGSIEQAAWGHATVAYQRAKNDPRRFECLRTQAELFAAVGYTDGARLYLEEAAGQAEATGDPYDAAMTWVDAALLAKKSGSRWEALELASNARALVSNPALDIDQRAAILLRLDPGF